MTQHTLWLARNVSYLSFIVNSSQSLSLSGLSAVAVPSQNGRQQTADSSATHEILGWRSGDRCNQNLPHSLAAPPSHLSFASLLNMMLAAASLHKDLHHCILSLLLAGSNAILWSLHHQNLFLSSTSTKITNYQFKYPLTTYLLLLLILVLWQLVLLQMFKSSWHYGCFYLPFTLAIYSLTFNLPLTLKLFSLLLHILLPGYIISALLLLQLATYYLPVYLDGCKFHCYLLFYLGSFSLSIFLLMQCF